MSHPEGKAANSTPITYGKGSPSPGVVDPLAMDTVGGSAPNAATWPTEGVCEGRAEVLRGGSGAGSA